MTAFWGAGSGSGVVWPTEPQELLLKAALLADERALAAWAKVRPEMDVAKLDGPVQAVLPHLRANLLALGVEDELLGLFNGVHRYVWARNQLLLARMMPVVASLEQAGIATLLLKGAALVAGTRLDAGMRPMQDVDVLVPTSSVARAAEVLLQSELEPLKGVPPWYVTDYAHAFTTSWGFEPVEPGHSFQLDLHWHALYVSCQPDADVDFWERSREVEPRGVRTRALAPADELLLVLLHGLLWNQIPTYRWVLDAALIVRGESGPVDFERLVEQARRRRLVAAVSAGLSYLSRTVSAPVPTGTLRALRRFSLAPVERVELRARLRAPADRGAVERAVVKHQQLARREQPLGTRPRLRPLSARRAHPGPGRPMSEFAAPIGTGIVDPGIEPVSPGEVIEFSDPERVRRHFLYGAWLPERDGCWLAGREARLVLRLEHAVQTGLLLGLSADALLVPGRVTRQRLELLVNGVAVGRFSLDFSRPALPDEGIVLPRSAVAGRDVLELTLRMPDAAAPGHAGPDYVDDGQLGIFLRSLVVREPAVCATGSKLALGIASGDTAVLAGGWSSPEPAGRWTHGSRASVLLRVADARGPLAVEIDAHPMRRGQLVEVSVNDGRRVRVLWVRAARRRVPVPADDEELLVGLRIWNPVSPAKLGLSEDSRPWGCSCARSGSYRAMNEPLLRLRTACRQPAN